MWTIKNLSTNKEEKYYSEREYNKIIDTLKDIKEVIEMPKYTCKEFLYIRGKINEVLNNEQ